MLRYAASVCVVLHEYSGNNTNEPMLSGVKKKGKRNEGQRLSRTRNYSQHILKKNGQHKACNLQMCAALTEGMSMAEKLLQKEEDGDNYQCIGRK